MPYFTVVGQMGTYIEGRMDSFEKLYILVESETEEIAKQQVEKYLKENYECIYKNLYKQPIAVKFLKIIDSVKLITDKVFPTNCLPLEVFSDYEKGTP